MGIKDNFSQAVKELWKKDGLEETGEKTDKPAQPTELDRYLNAPQEQFQQEQALPQQMMGQTAQQSAQPVQPGQIYAEQDFSAASSLPILAESTLPSAGLRITSAAPAFRNITSAAGERSAV